MDKEDVLYIYICIYIYIHTYIHTHTHTYNGILLSHKKNEIIPFVATWMDLEIILLHEVSQKDKDKYHDIVYLCNIKESQMSTDLWMPRGRSGGGGKA